MKAVLDTNVLISGLLWQGKPNELLERVAEGELTLCSSKHLAQELRDVLQRKKFSRRLAKLDVSAAELLEVFEQYARFYPDIPFRPVVKQDPADDRVLACAVSAGADMIVTGDSHLLCLESYEDIEILTARQALAKLPRRKN